MAAELIYWDSDAYLGWLQEEPSKVELCDGTFHRAQMGEVIIFTSALTLAEVLWRRGGPRLPRDKADMLNRFFRRSYFRVRNVTRKIAEQAQQLYWTNGIAPKDAIHVATALSESLVLMETFDAELLKKSGLLGSPPLVIRQPIGRVQGDMFSP